MGKIKMETGVVVITLTATVYRGIIRETHSSRIGFCGEYNKEILSKMGDEFKKIYAGQIEADNPLFRDRLRYIAGNNELCQTFHNRRLSDAWFPDQARIILRPAA